MGQIAERIEEFASRLHPAINAAGAETFRQTINEFRGVIRQMGDIEQEVADGLRRMLVDREWRSLILWLQAASTRPSPGLTTPLCELLSVRDTYLQHEWVAELLGEIGDPQAVAALSEACSFDVDEDGFRSLPRRCLQALALIGTPAAIAAIESKRSSPWPEVRDEATRLLTRGIEPPAEE